MRIAVTVIVAWLGVIAACAPASAAKMPPEGVFENCRLDTTMQLCAERLHVMHAGGVRVVVIPAWGATLTSLASYAATADSLGMSVMWELGNAGWWDQPSTGSLMLGSFPAFADACGCAQNGALLAFVAHWLGSLRGTYGYYAADDSMLPRHGRAAVKSYVAQIKRSDPGHPVMISSFCASQAREYGGIGAIIGQELYPVTIASLLPVAAHEGVWRTVGQRAAETQVMADSAHQPSAFILQAFTWGDNLDDGAAVHECSQADTKSDCYARLRYPSAQAQLELRNEVLLHARPRLILWWSFPGTFGDVTGDTYSIYPAGAEAAARWRRLSAAIQAPSPTAHGTTPTATVASHRKSARRRGVHKRPWPRRVG